MSIPKENPDSPPAGEPPFLDYARPPGYVRLPDEARRANLWLAPRVAIQFGGMVFVYFLGFFGAFRPHLNELDLGTMLVASSVIAAYSIITGGFVCLCVAGQSNSKLEKNTPMIWIAPAIYIGVPSMLFIIAPLRGFPELEFLFLWLIVFPMAAGSFLLRRVGRPRGPNP